MTTDGLEVARKQILSFRRLTWFCLTLVAATGIYHYWIVPGAAHGAFLMWASFFVVIPIALASQKLRCPSCGKNPFHAKSRDAWKIWTQGTMFYGTSCINCGAVFFRSGEQ